MQYQRQSVAVVADDIRDSLRRHNEAEARRLAFHFVEEYDSATDDERQKMVGDEPPPTEDERFDALVAAVVEFSCARHSTPPPAWVDTPSRFLERWWFMSGMRSLHADAIAHSPISFARRGIFLTEDALTYA